MLRELTPTVYNWRHQTPGLSAGDYVVTVTDAKGCTDTFNINIPEPSAIIVAILQRQLLVIIPQANQL
jgi:hypothetical protein